MTTNQDAAIALNILVMMADPIIRAAPLTPLEKKRMMNDLLDGFQEAVKRGEDLTEVVGRLVDGLPGQA